MSPFQAPFEPVFGDEAVQTDFLFPVLGSSRMLLRAPSPLCPQPETAPHGVWMPLKHTPLARGTRAPRLSSIVDGFSPLPSLEYAAGSAVPDVCLLVLAAAQAPLATRHGDEQNDTRRATTPGGPAAAETPEPSPRSVVRAQLRRARPSDSPAQ